ncbi:MAG: hypothetical protein EXR54_08160 [Dehalococcoidia bacterium]|nr:hypothetical protein [Dehalococcoidia bacterium]MSQ17514.1 hypothetical protein [Dehalococcoidia bacterium]
MGILDWILVAIRWVHALAAVAWVGGSMFYALVLRPVWRRSNPGQEVSRAVGTEFRSVVTSAMAVLLISGTVLTVSRLTSKGATLPYVAVLVVKILLAVYMFYTVWVWHRPSKASDPDVAEGRWRRARRRLAGTNAVLITGVVVFGLADVLDALFERGLAR